MKDLCASMKKRTPEYTQFFTIQCPLVALLKYAVLKNVKFLGIYPHNVTHFPKLLVYHFSARSLKILISYINN